MRKTSLSPKKGDLIDVSNRMVCTAEYESNILEADLKVWEEQFLQLEHGTLVLEKIVGNPNITSNPELNKIFANCNSMIEKVQKQITATRKHFNKLQLDFDKKLLAPYAKASVSSQPASMADPIKLNVDKIQECINAKKQVLDTVSDQCNAYTNRLAIVEPTIYKICLSDEIESTAKILEKLNTKMELLCKETAQFHIGANPAQNNPEKINGSILQLYNMHKKGDQLLECIQKNLQPNDGSSSSPKIEAQSKAERSNP